MKIRLILSFFLLWGLAGSWPSGLAQQRAAEPKADPAQVLRKGPHDFDFELGRWKIHIRRARSAANRATSWDNFDGTTANCKLWDGAAIQKWQGDGRAGHIEGLTLRLYDPQSRQWKLYAADRGDGILAPAVVGEFRGGRGVFLDQEPINGRMMWVRSVWSDITANSVHFEASVSDAAGKTWILIAITDQTRLAEPGDCGGLSYPGDLARR